MAKYSGRIGFAASEEKSPGVWEDTIVERAYYGDVIKSAFRYNTGEGINDDFTITNAFSIVGDTYLEEHMYAMKYITWMNTYWSISSIEVNYPRFTVNIGGVYNGPKARVTF